MRKTVLSTKLRHLFSCFNPKLEVLFLFCGLIFSQCIYYFYSHSHAATIQLTIQSLANREDIGSNSYKFSQAIENLEMIGALKCSKIKLVGSEISFLDTGYKGGCTPNTLNMLGSHVSLLVKSNSGNEWLVSTVAVHGFEVRIILWIMRILAVLFAVCFAWYLKFRIREINHEKDKEIAKREGMLLIAKQVAHDIRAPLTAIEIALKDESGDSNDKRKLLTQASSRIKAIAEDLLKESKEARLKQQNVLSKLTFVSDLNHEINFDVSESVLSIVREKNLSVTGFKIEINGLEEKLFAVGDKDDFERSLSNLLQNSLEALAGVDSPTILVAVRNYSSKIQVSITDNGIGIPQEVLFRVGDEGFSHGKAEGNGLGVSYSRKKLREWGGDLQIASREGVGTMVNVFLKKA